MGCRVMRLLLELAQKMVETMPWIGAISFDLGPAPVLKEIQCKDLPVRFAGRAFLCRGRGEPDHCGRHVLRAGRVWPRLSLDRCRPPGAQRLRGRGHRRRRRGDYERQESAHYEAFGWQLAG